jgi:Short C-terminal domain
MSSSGRSGTADRGHEHSLGSPDIADQIKKLADLRDQGVLTEDEFQQKKAELLAKM